jgi:predicted anti-sigma-YlaC factor YlaD
MMTKHLTQDNITGYIYNSLDDAYREIMDAHLLDCQACRANLTEQEFVQRQITNELDAILKGASPSPGMKFTGIASDLQVRQSKLNLWPRLYAIAPVTVAFFGLLFAIIGIWQVYIGKAVANPAQPLGAFPTLACFFFMLASVGQFDRSLKFQPRFIFTWMAVLILWLGSAFIGLLNLIVIRDLTIMAVTALGGSAADATPITIIAVMIGALFYIGIVIGGGEYHYRNIGQPGSWKLFSIVILGQLFIMIIPYLIW